MDIILIQIYATARINGQQIKNINTFVSLLNMFQLAVISKNKRIHILEICRYSYWAVLFEYLDGLYTSLLFLKREKQITIGLNESVT